MWSPGHPNLKEVQSLKTKIPFDVSRQFPTQKTKNKNKKNNISIS